MSLISNSALRNQLLANISTAEELSAWLGTTKEELEKATEHDSPEYGYESFEVAKKNGGSREIRAPGQGLLRILRVLNTHLTTLDGQLSDCAHGFRPRNSILSNALAHCNRRFVLNLDLRNFFGSISIETVATMLRKPPLSASPRIAETIANICCDQGALPQGAPTSPILANLACTDLDTQLAQVAQTNNCIYTRYADDISISTNSPTFPSEIALVAGARPDAVQLAPEFLALFARANARVNYDKVRISSSQQHQEVTGLKVNTRPLVRTRLIMKIRASLHAVEKFGLDACEANVKKQDPQAPTFRSVLQGRLAFVKFIHGDGERVVRRLEQRAVRSGIVAPSPDLDARSEEEFWRLKVADRLFQIPGTSAAALRTKDGVAMSLSAHELLRKAQAKPSPASIRQHKIAIRRPGPCEGELCLVIGLEGSAVSAVRAIIRIDPGAGPTVLAGRTQSITESALVLDLRGRVLGFAHNDWPHVLLSRDYVVRPLSDFPTPEDQPKH